MARSKLTLAFIDARPLAAVRTLESMPPQTAASFLEAMPARYATRLLSRADSWFASSTLRLMSAEGGIAVVREIPQREAAAILRLIPDDARERLLQDVPAGLRRALESALSFADDTVGAHMSPQVLSATIQESVADARAQLLHAPPEVEFDMVIVVDESRHVLGAVTAAKLLRARDDTKLSDLMVEVPTLPARARLQSVIRSDVWTDLVSVPVVNTARQLVGILPRSASHDLGTGVSHAEQEQSFPLQLMAAYASSMIELATLMLGPENPESDDQRIVP